MQTNYGTSGTSSYPNYANPPQPKPVPGLKVAYGSHAQAPSQAYNPINIPITNGTMAQNIPGTEPRGLFAKVKKKLFHMVTEEAPTDYPIGISQLSRKTFQASGEEATSLFRSGQAIQDYRFNLLVEPKRR